MGWLVLVAVTSWLSVSGTCLPKLVARVIREIAQTCKHVICHSNLHPHTRPELAASLRAVRQKKSVSVFE